MDVITATRASADIAAPDVSHRAWNEARPVRLKRYWSGADAPPERQAQARILWTPSALCVRFDCRQHEPLVISSEPQVEQKTLGLWERDVCEIFVAPDASDPQSYFEFEAAPTGEWLDLRIRQTPDARETDWQYASGMTAAARTEVLSVTIVLCVPWEAFGRVPRGGERWRANLFRCVGSGETRGYLAWRPTGTERPNFHVPQAFGQLEFVENYCGIQHDATNAEARTK